MRPGWILNNFLRNCSEWLLDTSRPQQRNERNALQVGSCHKGDTYSLHLPGVEPSGFCSRVCLWNNLCESTQQHKRLSRHLTSPCSLTHHFKVPAGMGSARSVQGQCVCVCMSVCVHLFVWVCLHVWVCVTVCGVVRDGSEAREGWSDTLRYP
jgi:hypothetical protein